MHVKRTATIVVGVGALAAWFAGAATSNRGVSEPLPYTPSAIETRGAELATEIARLRERLRPSAMPRQAGRNLFSFHKTLSPTLSAPVADAAPRAALVEAPVARVPPAFALRLTGIGEDPGPDGPIRMAFLSGDGQLLIVKVGETVTTHDGAYTVTEISADVVQLTKVDDGTTKRLALR